MESIEKLDSILWILVVSVVAAAIFGSAQGFYNQLSNVFSQMGFSSADPYYSVYFSAFNSFVLFLIIPCLAFGAFYFFGSIAIYNARQNYKKLFSIMLLGYVVGYCLSYFPIFFFVNHETTYFPNFGTFAATMVSLAIEIGFYGIVFSFTGFSGLAFSYFRRQNRPAATPIETGPAQTEEGGEAEEEAPETSETEAA